MRTLANNFVVDKKSAKSKISQEQSQLRANVREVSRNFKKWARKKLSENWRLVPVPSLFYFFWSCSSAGGVQYTCF
jgi:hypothetical protein